jgi:hypothetical protein
VRQESKLGAVHGREAMASVGLYDLMYAGLVGWKEAVASGQAVRLHVGGGMRQSWPVMIPC